MIKDYTDHAANERTFLAWIRTAVSIVGIGLVVVNISRGKDITKPEAHTGFWLLALGIVLIFAAGVRFLITRKLIRSNKETSATPIILDILLAIVLMILIAVIAGFGAHITSMPTT